jgi:hypothetical protein
VIIYDGFGRKRKKKTMRKKAKRNKIKLFFSFSSINFYLIKKKNYQNLDYNCRNYKMFTQYKN